MRCIHHPPPLNEVTGKNTTCRYFPYLLQHQITGDGISLVNGFRLILDACVNDRSYEASE